MPLVFDESNLFFSSLLTLYNETNDQLQELLRVRQAEPSAQPNNDGVTKRCEVLEKRCDVLEKERDRYKEVISAFHYSHKRECLL